MTIRIFAFNNFYSVLIKGHKDTTSTDQRYLNISKYEIRNISNQFNLKNFRWSVNDAHSVHEIAASDSDVLFYQPSDGENDFLLGNYFVYLILIFLIFLPKLSIPKIEALKIFRHSNGFSTSNVATIWNSFDMHRCNSWN